MATPVVRDPSSSSSSSGSGSWRSLVRAGWMMVSNGIMAFAWSRVVWILLWHYYYDHYVEWSSTSRQDHAAATTSTWGCSTAVIPAVRIALTISFLELVNAVTGITRSPPAPVLLFAVVRFGVEWIVAPQLESCDALLHLLTVTCWSIGDAIRFSCFGIDSGCQLLPQRRRRLVAAPGSSSVSTSSSRIQNAVKAVRYTVGPILFPIGAAGEMLMVLAAAQRKQGNAKLWTWAAASLWPVGFYPLFTQLLKQRQKFFANMNNKPRLASVEAKNK